MSSAKTTYNTYRTYSSYALIIQSLRAEDGVAEVEHHVAIVRGVEIVLCNRQAHGANGRMIDKRQIAYVVQIISLG